MRWPMAVPALRDPTPPKPSERMFGAAALDLVPSRVVACLAFSDPTTEPIVRGYQARSFHRPSTGLPPTFHRPSTDLPPTFHGLPLTFHRPSTGLPRPSMAFHRPSEPIVRCSQAALSAMLRQDGLTPSDGSPEEQFRLAQFDALNSFGGEASDCS